MKSSYYLVLLALLLFIAPKMVIAGTISCDPSNVEVVSTEGADFVVEVYSTSAWTATANKSWVTFSPASGAGDAFVSVSVQAGEVGTAKVLFSNGESSATLTITCKAPSGELSGKFSVNADKKVIFSKGNAQYQPSTDTWRFAENQYDYVGNDNSFIGSQYYSGWIDLFGWGTGANPTQKSTTGADYATFVDWGVNAFVNGGAEGNIWRTLTQSEWLYLFRGRENAETLWGLGKVNNVKGLIILPDDWTLPSGMWFRASTTRGFTWGTYSSTTCYYNDNGGGFGNNTYSATDWETMEANGAVFLPAAGYRRSGTEIKEVSTYGGYWSSTLNGGGSGYHLMLSDKVLGPWYYTSRYIGNSVRLVKEVSDTPSGFENLSTSEGVKKFFNNGRIMIQRGGKTYTIQGQEVH